MHSKAYLSDLAKKVIHAYENKDHIYHHASKTGIYFLMLNFNLSEQEVINKIKVEIL
jgi:hypothetical protein